MINNGGKDGACASAARRRVSLKWRRGASAARHGDVFRHRNEGRQCAGASSNSALSGNSANDRRCLSISEAASRMERWIAANNNGHLGAHSGWCLVSRKKWRHIAIEKARWHAQRKENSASCGSGIGRKHARVSNRARWRVGGRRWRKKKKPPSGNFSRPARASDGISGGAEHGHRLQNRSFAAGAVTVLPSPRTFFICCAAPGMVRVHHLRA